MAIGRDVVSENDVFVLGKISRQRCIDTCSQPFGKPNISERTVRPTKWMNSVFRLIKSIEHTSDHRNRRLIKNVGTEINRISEAQMPCLLTSINEDYWSLNECCSIILKWADLLKNIPCIDRKTSVNDLCPDKQHRDHMTTAQKEARKTVSEWAASLKSVPEGSVCVAEDVRYVLEDLQRKWKMGQLPNMLPALDFMMWSVLREYYFQTQQTCHVQLSYHPSQQILVH